MKKIKKYINHNEYFIDIKYKKSVSYCKEEKHIHYKKLGGNFVRVQYVENRDSTFIDTEIIPDSETGVYIDFEWTDENKRDTYLFGLRDSTGNTRWTIGINPNRIYYGYGGYSGPFIYPQLYDRNQTSLNFYNDKKFKLNSETELDLPTLSFNPTNNIRIFGSSGVQASYSHSIIRIYNMRITQGNEIIMNLIPIKMNELGYMYDAISDTILYPQNGTLIAGPEI